jgi:hypothetical protein
VSDDDRKAVERLRAENERLKGRQARGVSLKVSEKGGVSLYGMGRFPITLYKEQWLKLLDMADDIRQFIRENRCVAESEGREVTRITCPKVLQGTRPHSGPSATAARAGHVLPHAPAARLSADLRLRRGDAPAWGFTDEAN